MVRSNKTPEPDPAISTADTAPAKGVDQSNTPSEREHDHDVKARERARRPRHMSEGTRQEILQHGEAFDPSVGRIVTRAELEGTSD